MYSYVLKTVPCKPILISLFDSELLKLLPSIRTQFFFFRFQIRNTWHKTVFFSTPHKNTVQFDIALINILCFVNSTINFPIFLFSFYFQWLNNNQFLWIFVHFQLPIVISLALVFAVHLLSQVRQNRMNSDEISLHIRKYGKKQKW